MQVKLEFELNTPCPKTGVIYNGSFLNKLDEFITESGVVVMHNELGKYTKSDFIGLVTGYNILKNKYVVLVVHQMNERFNALNNVEGYLKGLPRVVGKILDNGVADIEKIETIEVIV